MKEMDKIGNNAEELKELKKRIVVLNHEIARNNLAIARTGKGSKSYFLFAIRTLLNIEETGEARKAFEEIGLTALNVGEFYKDYSIAIEILRRLGHKDMAKQIEIKQAEEWVEDSPYVAALFYLKLGMRDEARGILEKMESTRDKTYDLWKKIKVLNEKLGEKEKVKIADQKLKKLGKKKAVKTQSNSEVTENKVKRQENELFDELKKEEKDFGRILDLLEYLQSDRGLKPEEEVLQRYVCRQVLDAPEYYGYAQLYIECAVKVEDFDRAIERMEKTIAMKQASVDRQKILVAQFADKADNWSEIIGLANNFNELHSDLRQFLKIRKAIKKRDESESFPSLLYNWV